MNKLTITKTVHLKAPASHVWKFLTEAEQLGEWFHRGKSDLVSKGEYALLSDKSEDETLIWGDILEFDPHKRLVHTFTHGHLQGVETTCTWSLVEIDGGTILTLVHEGWEKVGEAAFDMTANHDVGWDDHFARLRKATH